MLDINFFDDPTSAPRAREDVRFKQLGFFVHPPDGRRIGIGFDITPFIERPSIEVVAVNARGERAGTLTVVQTLQANFNLTLHLRDKEPTAAYTIMATLYYSSPENGRMDVHQLTGALDVTAPPRQFTVSAGS